jgi:hypothetical protein
LLIRSVAPLSGGRSASIIHRRRLSIRSAAPIVTVSSVAIVLAPPVLADSVATAKDAIASLRGGTSCPALRDNPIVEQAADIINRSTDDYLNHTATRTPIEDPLPGLKDLGYTGNKAVLLLGSNPNEAGALKGALLEGYAAIPDCSYTDYGVSVRRNESTGHSLISIVLAGD